MYSTLGTSNSGYLSLRPGIQTHSNSFIGDVYSPPDITSMSYRSRRPPSVTTSNRSFLPSELNRQQQHMCIHHMYAHSSLVHAFITRTCIHHMYMHSSHVHAFITCTCIHETYAHAFTPHKRQEATETQVSVLGHLALRAHVFRMPGGLSLTWAKPLF